MALAALGTDTGGSCRVPAAMCGIVGYKPTARRVPITGVLPLSPSLDSVGPLANSVACCATVDAVLAGQSLPTLTPANLAGLRIAVPTTIMLDGLDETVAATFAATLKKLSAAGARIVETPFPSFGAIPIANRAGGFAAAEAFAWHRALLAEKAAGYDPRVRKRIERGSAMLAADYIDLLAARADIIAQFETEAAPYDVLAMPTCPLIPPAIAALDGEDEYNRVNLLQLRNTTIGNFLDCCAISLPCHQPGTAPVGLMLMRPAMGDAALFAIAAAVEAAL
jgi:aspartyl-tRNA(Asn)/glutamyl-tRNA(Gln) amidotransferase subunit A